MSVLYWVFPGERLLRPGGASGEGREPVHSAVSQEASACFVVLPEGVRPAPYETALACAGIWHRTVQLPFAFEGVYVTAPPCIVIRLLGRKASPGGGPGGGGGAGTVRGPDCWQRLHFFTGLPLSFRLLPFLFTHSQATAENPGRETDLAWQRFFFLPGPPTLSGAFLPCFRWTPLHLSVGPTTRPSLRSWQTPRRAWPTLLRWQLSSNLHDFGAQPTQVVPLAVTGHAAGAADAVTKRHTVATSASSTRQARRAGAPQGGACRAILPLRSASSLAVRPTPRVHY